MDAKSRLPNLDDWVYKIEDGQKKYGQIRQIIIDRSGTHLLVEWAIIDTYKTMHTLDEDVYIEERGAKCAKRKNATKRFRTDTERGIVEDILMDSKPEKKKEWQQQ